MLALSCCSLIPFSSRGGPSSNCKVVREDSEDDSSTGSSTIGGGSNEESANDTRSGMIAIQAVARVPSCACCAPCLSPAVLRPHRPRPAESAVYLAIGEAVASHRFECMARRMPDSPVRVNAQRDLPRATEA